MAIISPEASGGCSFCQDPARLPCLQNNQEEWRSNCTFLKIFAFLLFVLVTVSPFVELTTQPEAGSDSQRASCLCVPSAGITGVHDHLQLKAYMIYASKDRPDLALGSHLSVSHLIPQGFGVSMESAELLCCEI